MADPLRDDGSIADLPWGAVFDPVINARALSAVQTRGFRAAREVVDRFISMAADVDVDVDVDFASAGTESKEDDTGADRSTATTSILGGLDIESAVGSIQGLLGQFANSIRGTLTEQSGSPAMFDLRMANAGGQVVLNADGPGAVSTEVWLHNGGPEDMGKIRLRCSDLLAHDGAVIESACVRFEPDVVAMPARSSRGIIVEVDVAEEHEPGTYRGTLLADGQPDVWLPVLLVVSSELGDLGPFPLD